MMKSFLIFSSLILAIVASPQGYRSSQSHPNSRGISSPLNNNNNNLGPQGRRPPTSASGANGAKVYKYVSIHVAPTESADLIPAKAIVPTKPPDTHYQIIFVKAPNEANQLPQEIELPPEPIRKTVVYVLVKKPEAGESDIKIRPAPPTTPSKPEVFFVRYKDSDKLEGDSEGNVDGPAEGQSAGQEQQVLPEQVSSVQEAYGPPAQQQRQQQQRPQGFFRPVQPRPAPNAPSNSYGPPRL